MPAISLFCHGFALLLLILSILPQLGYPAWWIRGWDFPRLQLLWLAMALLIVQLSSFDLTAPPNLASTFIVLACLTYHLGWIVPYTRLWHPEVRSAVHVPGGAQVRILSANVLMTNRNAAELLHSIRQADPDIIATIETDTWWEEALAELDTGYPYTLRCPQKNLYGMHVWSRLELSETRISFLVEDDKPSMHMRVSLPDGKEFSFHCMHPAPPSPTENRTSVERDGELLALARSVRESSLPVIVSGDLNDVAWSTTTRLFRKTSGLLDPRIGRGMFNTFHARYWFIRWPLDHLFHSRDFTLVSMERMAHFGSDHFGLLTTLELHDAAVNGQTAPANAPGDTVAVSQLIEQADADAAVVPTPGPSKR